MCVRFDFRECLILSSSGIKILCDSNAILDCKNTTDNENHSRVHFVRFNLEFIQCYRRQSQMTNLMVFQPYTDTPFNIFICIQIWAWE